MEVCCSARTYKNKRERIRVGDKREEGGGRWYRTSGIVRGQGARRKDRHRAERHTEYEEAEAGNKNFLITLFRCGSTNDEH